ncbi:hypothetical protein HDV06_004419 [Boothiomyces sp. JEL0866]|nr:hypothetical protein HDV06_004419 [Boothiomyces sp. JEL0866]
MVSAKSAMLSVSFTPVFFVGNATFPLFPEPVFVGTAAVAALVLVGALEAVVLTVEFELAVAGCEAMELGGGTQTPLTQINPTTQSVLQIGLPTVVFDDPVAAKTLLSNRKWYIL